MRAGLANTALLNPEADHAGHDARNRAETGGKAYINQNEIKDGIALAVADENASYSIGYYPENKKWDGKFRNIKVKLDRGDRRSVIARAISHWIRRRQKNSNSEQDVAGRSDI